MDRKRALDPVPGAEDQGEHHAVENRRGDVGNAEADVEDVSGHRAENAHHRHRQPVGPGHVAVLDELQVERDAEGDATKDDGDLRHQGVDQEIGGRLPHRRGQRLDDPKEGGDFGHLGQRLAVAFYALSQIHVCGWRARDGEAREWSLRSDERDQSAKATASTTPTTRQ